MRQCPVTGQKTDAEGLSLIHRFSSPPSHPLALRYLKLKKNHETIEMLSTTNPLRNLTASLSFPLMVIRRPCHSGYIYHSLAAARYRRSPSKKNPLISSICLQNYTRPTSPTAYELCFVL